ncbi:MAG: type II toxin-antitoxin system VapB family antitoxin [Akkermansiaceae bacterium]
MRTTVTIDDELFDKACEMLEEKNASSVITKALNLLIATENKKRILRLSGAMQDFSVPNRGERVNRR